ncbi:hypothetical protein T484DRAFT_1853335, partial [Baffinella frigidus]
MSGDGFGAAVGRVSDDGAAGGRAEDGAAGGGAAHDGAAGGRASQDAGATGASEEVRALLVQWNLQSHAALLAELGLERVSDLKYLRESDAEHLPIPTLAKRKVQAMLAWWREENVAEPPMKKVTLEAASGEKGGEGSGGAKDGPYAASGGGVARGAADAVGGEARGEENAAEPPQKKATLSVSGKQPRASSPAFTGQGGAAPGLPSSGPIHVPPLRAAPPPSCPSPDDPDAAGDGQEGGEGQGGHADGQHIEVKPTKAEKKKAKKSKTSRIKTEMRKEMSKTALFFLSGMKKHVNVERTSRFLDRVAPPTGSNRAMALKSKAESTPGRAAELSGARMHRFDSTRCDAVERVEEENSTEIDLLGLSEEDAPPVTTAAAKSFSTAEARSPSSTAADTSSTTPSATALTEGGGGGGAQGGVSGGAQGGDGKAEVAEPKEKKVKIEENTGEEGGGVSGGAQSGKGDRLPGTTGEVKMEVKVEVKAE